MYQDRNFELLGCPLKNDSSSEANIIWMFSRLKLWLGDSNRGASMVANFVVVAQAFIGMRDLYWELFEIAFAKSIVGRANT